MITIDGLEFDLKRGEILKPEADAVPFPSSYSPGIGIQVTSKRGPGFTLTLTRYDSHDLVESIRTSIRNRIGKIVYIVDRYHGVRIDYLEPIQGNLKFAVSQARVIETQNIAAWQGFRFGMHYKYAPAIKVVSQWTMYAVEQ